MVKNTAEKIAIPDEELCSLAADGSRDAEEELVTRYYSMVRSCARPLFLLGGDSEDLIQEGMLGLLQAIRRFDRTKEASFHTFAEVCIRNRIFSVLRAAQRDKHSPLSSLLLHSLVSSPAAGCSATIPGGSRRVVENRVTARRR